MKTQLLRYAAMALLAVPGLAAASTVDVPITCSGGIDAALTSAIAQLSPGVTDVRVLLSAGTCSIGTQHAIDGAVSFTVIGAGIASTTIGTYAAEPFHVGGTTGGATLNISGVAFQKFDNGVIDIHNSTLDVDQVRFYNASAPSGSYIAATASTVTIKRSRFEFGYATAGGGAITASGGYGAFGLSVSDTTFSQNLAHDGGAIWADVPMTLDRSVFLYNHADTGFGGAVFVAGQSVAIRNSTFTANGSFQGGAIYFQGVLSSYSVLLNNVTLYHDIAQSGSELYLGGNSTLFANINNTLVGGSCAGLSSALPAHGTIESPGNTCLFPASGNQLGVADADLHLGMIATAG